MIIVLLAIGVFAIAAIASYIQTNSQRRREEARKMQEIQDLLNVQNTLISIKKESSQK